MKLRLTRRAARNIATKAEESAGEIIILAVKRPAQRREYHDL
jgi:hypothetical protein